jgi:PAS domain S-box-containing protein
MDFEKLAFEHLEMGLLVQGPDTRTLYANPAASRLLSLDTAEVLSRASTDPVWDVIGPDGQPIPNEEFAAVRVARTGKPVRGVVFGLYRPRTRDRAWMTVDAFPVLDDNGDVEYIVSLFRPITEDSVGGGAVEVPEDRLREIIADRTAELEAQVQQVRKESTEYRLVVEAMAEGVASYGRDGVLITANQAAQEILGLTEEQMRGQKPVDPRWQVMTEDGVVLTPDQIPIEITRKTGRRFRNFVMRVRRPPDDVAWLSVNTDPVEYAGEGAPYSAVATFTDITRERAALLSAEQARDRLRDVTEAVPGLILENVIHPDGSEAFTFASGQDQELFGVPPRAFMEDPARLWRCMAEEDRDRIWRMRDLTIQGDGAVDAEFQVTTPTGARWLHMHSGTPRREGDVACLTLIVIDVTDQRRISKTLYDTQRRQGLGVLAAGVAHNFNNMLAAIIPSIEEAMSGAGGDPAHALDDALQAAHGAADLVRQLMLLAGRGDDRDAEPVDLNELSEEVARICRRTMDPRVGLSVERWTGEGSPVVHARRAELQQVVLNLVLNGRDAAEEVPDPTVQVTVELAGSEALIHVRDNGAGMTDEVQAQIGQPFFTTKPAGKGTGLGLATAMGIVRDLGGRVVVDSAVGRGTVFTVRLPLAGPADQGSPLSTLPGESTSPDTEAPGVALVVDDEPLVRRAVARMVERTGLEVHQMEGGEETMEWLEANPAPDVIFVDLSMPGMSGADVLAAVRDRLADLPVVLMSGYVPDESVTEQASAVLQKPMRSSDIRAILDRLLGD